MYAFGVLATLFAIVMGQVSAGCERPLEVRGVEDYCWSSRVEMSEQIHEVEIKVVNFARKKLGMDIDEPNEPQKLNPQYDVPCIDRTSKWVKKNVVYNQAVGLLDRIKMCSILLANSTASNVYFDADNVDKSVNDKSKDNPKEPQSKCEISKEYMKCLAVAEQDIECPIFMYP